MTPIRIVRKTLLVTAGLGLLVTGPAMALSVSFARIVDTNTSIPGTSEPFAFFDPVVSIDRGDAVFGGAREGGFFSPYAYEDGTIRSVANDQTPIPGGAGSFTLFAQRNGLDDGRLAFLGLGEADQQGIYQESGGTLRVIADRSTPIPNKSGVFDSFGTPSSADGLVVFRGSRAFADDGLYTDVGGALDVLVDDTTPIPGGTGNFRTFGVPETDGGEVAFRGTGRNGTSGIYVANGGDVRLVADQSSAIPGGTGNFAGFAAELSIHGGEVAFKGFDASNAGGLYTDAGGSLSLVADLDTAIPEGTGTFSFLTGAAIENGRVAFLGNGPGRQTGIYLKRGEELLKVVAAGDTIDGSTLVSLSFSEKALSENQIAFSASFLDGSRAVYVATIPEPSTALLIAIGLLGLAVRRTAG